MGLYSRSASISSSSDKDPRYWTSSKLADKLRSTERIIDSLRAEIRQLERWVTPLPRGPQSFDSGPRAMRGDKDEQLAHLREDLKRVRAKRDDAGERLDHAARAVRNPLESMQAKAEARIESQYQAARDDELLKDETYLLRKIEDVEEGRTPQYTASRAMHDIDDDNLTPGQKDLRSKRRVLESLLKDEKAYKLEMLDRDGIKTRTISPDNRQHDSRGRPRSPSMRRDSTTSVTRRFSRKAPLEPEIVYDEEPRGRMPGDSFRERTPSPIPYDHVKDPLYIRRSSPLRSYSPPVTRRVTKTIYRVLSPPPSKLPSLTRSNSSSRSSSSFRNPSVGRLNPLQYLDPGPQPTVAYTTQYYQTPSPAFSNPYQASEQRCINGSWVNVHTVAPNPYTAAPHTAASPLHSSYAPTSSSKGRGKTVKGKKLYIVRRR